MGILTALIVAGSVAAAEGTIVDFAPGFDLTSIEQNDVKLTLLRPRQGRAGALRIETFHSIEWPGITIKAPKGKWDLSKYAAVAMDVHNPTEKTVYVGLRVDSPGGDGGRNCAQQMFRIEAGNRLTVKTDMIRKMPEGMDLFGMRGFPPNLRGYRAGDRNMDPADVTQMIIFVSQPKEDYVFEISLIRGDGLALKPPSADELFPFIDRYGQFMHRDWPGKIHAAADFESRKKEEGMDLAAHPGPEGRNAWGGWKKGPRLKKTGFFYPAKYDSKWWLVDPDGYLFYSHGVDCAGTWTATVIDERDHWFKDFPGEKQMFAEYYWETKSRDNSYWGGRKVKVFNFAGANAKRKYGKEWEGVANELAHRRLKSWGFNTIGNWSSRDLCLMKKTPYTVAVHYWSRQIEGSEDHPGSFYDVFDTDFRKAIRKRMNSEKDMTAGDPYCIGYFVDNELRWGGDLGLALSTLASPASQPAKKEFMRDLKEKYETVHELNKAWHASYASWSDIEDSRSPVTTEEAKPDQIAFTHKFAAKYFKECRDAVKAVAPNNLYLGCRFAGWGWESGPIILAAGEFCDVISFNLYWRDVSGFKLADGVDRPVVIGEFHFGALDRGMLHTGLQGVENQDERADAYRKYVTGALKNPVLVGSHWFQYRDQSTTGRFDGENYQIGFVDICDTPYPETIAAAREMGDKLYELRK